MTDRMSGAESIMWSVERDPALRSDFANITLLERAPDPDRARAKVWNMIEVVPRLTQCVITPPLHLAPPEWRTDPHFDIDYHVRWVELGAPGDLRSLLDFAAATTLPPFDRSRPLWEFTIVTGLADGRAALIQRLHHTLMDGVGALQISLSLVDFEPEPDALDAAAAEARARAALNLSPPHPTTANDGDVAVVATVGGAGSPIGRWAGALGYAASRPVALAYGGARRAVSVVTHPQRLPRTAADAWAFGGSLRRQAFGGGGSSRSPLLAERSSALRYDVLRVPFRPVRDAARAFGGSLNDGFVTAVAGGLGRYHAALGIDCPELRMAMPVNLRGDGPDESGNQFAPTQVRVPIQPVGAAERFGAVQATLRAARSEKILSAADAIAAIAAPLPAPVLVAATRTQTQAIDFATSNLRGSSVPVYLAGTKVEANFPFGPRTGCALNITVLSYQGSLDIGINSDPAAITDPELLLACLRIAFDDLVTGAGITL